MKVLKEVITTYIEEDGKIKITETPLVRCGECIWKEECTITELWGGRGFCPSGERRTDEGITE